MSSPWSQRRHLVLLAALAAVLLAPPAALAQPQPTLSLDGPDAVAPGGRVELTGAGAPAGVPVALERVRGPGQADRVGEATADSRGRFAIAYAPGEDSARLHRLRARAGDLESPIVAIRVRPLVLRAVGDINLGDGVATVMSRRGQRYPWSGVAATLRSADIAFGNLECSVSTRGSPVEKEFTFRGRPSALRVAATYAGMDVMNLANNHVGDFGRAAMLDTIRYVGRFGMTGVGAGRDLADAARPRVVERLGLRVAFVGFSDIGPASFAAGPGRPGTVFATDERIRSGVRAARRRADVVIATFHWGVERDRRENVRQRGFASVAVDAGADAVIGAHPHVLQPIRRSGRTLVAYSLGNFVWAAGSAFTSRTGILELGLSGRGVQRHRLLPARIENTRPRLLSRSRG